MTPRLSVFVFYLVFCLNHCAQARPHIPQYDYRRVREARSLCAPTHTPPRRREEPRDELCSSSTWPQTAPLTPRPVGRMGAVRACLKRRHSSAPVHARRAEGRALAGGRGGERGARGAAEDGDGSGALTREETHSETVYYLLHSRARCRCRRSEREKARCRPATGGARRVDSERAPAVTVRRAARPPHEWMGSGGHARRARACSRGQRGVWA